MAISHSFCRIPRVVLDNSTHLARPPFTRARPSRSSLQAFKNSVHDTSYTRNELLRLGLGLLAAAPLAGPTLAAEKGPGMGKYIKKKEFDAIDTYIPPLLEARRALARVGPALEADKSTAREKLRKGVFAGLRSNVRATAERLGTSEAADLATGFLDSLQAVDLALLQEARGEMPRTPASTRLEAAAAALDRRELHGIECKTLEYSLSHISHADKSLLVLQTHRSHSEGLDRAAGVPGGVVACCQLRNSFCMPSTEPMAPDSTVRTA
jgi:hypothetical protein